MSDQMDAAAPSRKPCPTLTPVFRHRKDTVAEKHHISDVELTPANVNVNTPELPRTQSKTKRPRRQGGLDFSRAEPEV